ncbi:MAG: NfeD family protein [Cyanobacteria bacterium P01_G01_bin.54]
MFNPFKALGPNAVGASVTLSPAQRVRQRLYAWQGEAIVEQTIAPDRLGRVRFQGTYWSAKCTDAISFAPGVMVEVIDRHNLTLIVRAMQTFMTQTTQLQ